MEKIWILKAVKAPGKKRAEKSGKNEKDYDMVLYHGPFSLSTEPLKGRVSAKADRRFAASRSGNPPPARYA